MRVSVYEPRKDDPATSIEYLSDFIQEGLDLRACADLLNAITTNDHRSVSNDRQFAQFSAKARSRRTGKGDQLTAINYAD
jgi:hypothetical protein